MPNSTRFRIPAACAAVLVGAALVLFWEQRPAPPPAGGSLFREQAREAGLDFQMHSLPNEQGEKFKINLYDHGCGVAVGDFDGDGHDDLYFCNQLGANALYRNKGDGTFEDVTQKAGVGLGDRVCVAAVFADYDNDGHQDLFVTSTRGGNVLFHNKGDGTFADVTKAAGVGYVGHSQAATFFDYDNDGRLDLLVLNTARWTGDAFDSAAHYFPGKEKVLDLAASPAEHHLLYHNEGDGTFREVTEASGLKGKGWGADAAVFDYDGDGRPDLFITCMFGPARLYRNQGKGTFADVTRAVLGRTPAGGMGARVFDFNNDGRLDLYVVDMHSDMWLEAGADLSAVKERRKNRYMWLPDEERGRPASLVFERKFADLVRLPYGEVFFGNGCYKNRGGGRFEEVSDRAGLETFWPWGVATGDFNNDGFEDAFVPSGMGHPWGYWPNRLLLNNGDETFSERSAAAGVEPPPRGIYLDRTAGGQTAARSSRSAAVADFDGDGRLEVVTNNFRDSPYYFRNVGAPLNYVAFRLRGTKSNRDAVGAVVRLYVGNEILTRAVPSAGGFLAQSSRTLHFGLGWRKLIDRVEITWPGGGTPQRLENVELNRLHTITEPDPPHESLHDRAP